MPLLADAPQIQLGSTTVTAIYLGEQKVWQSSGWTPKDITGLVVWWDASQETTIAGGLTDLAGSGVVGTLNGSPNPVLQQDATRNQYLRFRANQGKIRPTVSNGCAREWTLVYVGRMWGATFGRIWSGTTATATVNIFVGWYGGASAKGWGTAYDGQGWMPSNLTAINPNPPYPTPWVLSSADSTATGPLFRYWNNGNLIGSRSVSTVSLAGAGGLSGYQHNTSMETCDADFGELCLYNRKLSDVERLQVEGYMKTKWAVV